MKLRPSRTSWLPLLALTAGGPSAALAADAKQLFVETPATWLASLGKQ